MISSLASTVSMLHSNYNYILSTTSNANTYLNTNSYHRFSIYHAHFTSAIVLNCPNSFPYNFNPAVFKVLRFLYTTQIAIPSFEVTLLTRYSFLKSWSNHLHHHSTPLQ
jgi:hypothetical protein